MRRDYSQLMIQVGDRVRINRRTSALDGAAGEVIGVQPIEPRLGVVSSHLPISRLYTVRLDDGTLVERPLLVSDLRVITRNS